MDPLANIPNLVMSMGGSRMDAQLINRYMWFTPESSWPTSPVVMKIMTVLQRRLGQLGVPTRGDGLADVPTVDALRRISGPDWRFKNWVQIYRDVLVATDRPQGAHSMSYIQDMGAYNGHRARRGYNNRPHRWGGPWGVGAEEDDPLKVPTFCSERNTPTGCKPISGICTPMNAAVLEKFKFLQRQLNRILKMTGSKPLINVDGRIGPQTIEAVNVTGVVGAIADGPLQSSDCDWVSDDIDTASAEAKKVADFLGAPTSVPDPSSSKPSVVKPDGSIDNSMAQTGLMGVLTSPVGLAAIGLGTFLLLSHSDKKKRRKNPARRRRARRRRR